MVSWRLRSLILFSIMGAYSFFHVHQVVFLRKTSRAMINTPTPTTVCIFSLYKQYMYFVVEIFLMSGQVHMTHLFLLMWMTNKARIGLKKTTYISFFLTLTIINLQMLDMYITGSYTVQKADLNVVFPLEQFQ